MPASALERLSRASTYNSSMRGGMAAGRALARCRTFSLEHLSAMAGGGGDQAPLEPPPRPVIEYSGRVQAFLRRRCGEAQASLKRLASDRASGPRGGAPGAEPALPKAALHFCKVRAGAASSACVWLMGKGSSVPACRAPSHAHACVLKVARQPSPHPQGLVFTTQHKTGVLLGGSWGHALLIRRLPEGGFSAPLFFTLRSASVGLTMGYQQSSAVHVLQSEQQVTEYAADRSRSLSLDASVLLDGDPWEPATPQGTSRPVIK